VERRRKPEGVKAEDERSRQTYVTFREQPYERKQEEEDEYTPSSGGLIGEKRYTDERKKVPTLSGCNMHGRGGKGTTKKNP